MKHFNLLKNKKSEEFLEEFILVKWQLLALLAKGTSEVIPFQPCVMMQN